MRAQALEQLAPEGGGGFFGSRAPVFEGSSTRKIAPALGALVKVAPENPAKSQRERTPGTCKAISTTR